MLPAYTMPPKADHVKMLRALVKLNLSHALVNTLADDIAAACETLEKKGGASEAERKQVKTGVGYCPRQVNHPVGAMTPRTEQA